ncbi:MAG TPA: PilZ domain-containing protein [Terriglobales bacterium]|nr:PilZ domain-containing protein [Terriglobales bacterium]
MQISVVDLKALIVSPDTRTTSTFVQVFRDLKVIAQVCPDQSSPSERFAQTKFEAVVLDLDNILERIPFVQNLRLGRTNRNSVVLAVATNDSAKKRASEHDASFVVERPLIEEHLLAVLRAAYGFMLQDRRRYFRLVIELTVSIRTRSGDEFQCKTINISSEGLALRTPRSIQEGEIVGALFAISNPGPLIIAEGTVIWDDRHGKAGLHLRFASPHDRDRISEWLDSEFYMRCNIDPR